MARGDDTVIRFGDSGKRGRERAKGSTILGAIMTGRVEERERGGRERKGFQVTSPLPSFPDVVNFATSARSPPRSCLQFSPLY